MPPERVACLTQGTGCERDLNIKSKPGTEVEPNCPRDELGAAEQCFASAPDGSRAARLAICCLVGVIARWF